MKNYILKAVSVKLDEDNFVKQIPTDLLKEQNISIIPTIAFNVLKKQLNNNENDNFTYINKFLGLIKAFIDNNDEHLSSKYLHKLAHNEYTSIIESLDKAGLFKSIKKGFYDKENPANSKSAVYTLYSFVDYTFISLTEESDDGVVVLDYKLKELENTPLNNDTFINVLMNAKIHAAEAILAEYKYFKEPNKDGTLKTITSFISRVNAILNFLKFRFASKGDSVDRVYSSFSSLSKISRKFITYNGKPFYEVDIKNCQPLLLICLLIENGYSIDSDYVKNVVSGKFYESLMEEAKNQGYTTQKSIKSKNNELEFIDMMMNIRDDVKILCYSDIFFAKKLNNTNIVKVFKSLYPLVYDALKQLTEQENTLANQLQNLEADIVLNVVPKSPYFTVHDAIYLTNKTELENVKRDLAFEIKKRSGGRIENVMFGEIKDFKICMVDKNEVQTEVIYGSKLVRKVHSAKDARFNQFKELSQLMNKKEIMAALNITEPTYFRYKKQLKTK